MTTSALLRPQGGGLRRPGVRSASSTRATSTLQGPISTTPLDVTIDAKCYELVRQHRWPEGVRCPHCDGASVARGRPLSAL